MRREPSCENKRKNLLIYPGTRKGRKVVCDKYKVLNCLGQTITLRAESEDGPIQSPFGIHNVSISAGQFSSNHKKIVWNASEKNPKKQILEWKT